MKKHIFAIALSVICAGLFPGCAENSTAPNSDTWKAEHVVIIGMDGWGSYCMDKAEMPNVKALMKSGCYTLKKRSVLPSSSGVNWATMFMGACPELHGYTLWNSQTPEIPSRVVNKESGIFPTIFRLLREAHPETEIGFVYEWEGMKYVVDTLAMNYSKYVPESEALCDAGCEYLKAAVPALSLIYFDNPDKVGHKIGHDTPEYYEKLKDMDRYVGKIIDTLKELGIYDDTILILTSDHGGINKGHGGKTLLELETPFIIAGKNIRKGGEFEESMMQFDVASTIAYIFGLEQPQAWIGRPMTQVFE